MGPLASISPGQKFTVQVKLHNGSAHPLQLRTLALDKETKEHLPAIAPGQDFQTEFQTQLPATAAPTRPALHRDDPERDAKYIVDEPRYETVPFAPPPLRVVAQYDVPELDSHLRAVPAAGTHMALPEVSTPVLARFCG